MQAAKNFITFMLCVSHLELNSEQFAHVNLRVFLLLNFYFYLFS